MSDSIAQFTAERNAALLSMDKEVIEAFIVKWECDFPCRSENVFWAAVHKARLEIVSMPENEKEISRLWLRENGFKAYGGNPL